MKWGVGEQKVVSLLPVATDGNVGESMSPDLPVSVAAAWNGVKAAPFAAILIDADGVVRAANVAAATLWLADSEAVLSGQALFAALLSSTNVEDLDLHSTPGSCWSGYLRAQRLDGTSVELDGHFYPLTNSEDLDCFSVFVAQLSRRMPASSHMPVAMPESTSELAENRRFRLLVEQAPVEVWLMSEDLRVEYVNAAACDSLGLTAADLLGSSIHDIDMRRRVPEEVIEPVVVLGHVGTFEAAHRHADGHAVPKAIVCSMYEIEGRRFIGSFARDISERLATAAALIDRESQLNTVLEAFPGVVAAFSDSGRPLYVNEQFCRLFNRTRQEVLASEAKDLLGSERMAAIDDIVARLKSGEAVYTERCVNTGAGEEVILRTRFLMQADAQRPGCNVYFAFGTDVTELRKEQRRLASFVAGTRTATWEWSLRDESLLVNEYFSELTGYSLSDANRGISFWLPLVHAEDRPKRKALMLEVLHGGRDEFECEYRATHKSGRELWLLERAKVLRAAKNGVPQVVFGTLQDISQLRHTDAELTRLLQELEERVALRTAELREATENAERANSAKSEFLSFMSHELRTPLNAISGFGQLLSMTKLDADQRLHVGEVMAATDLLVRLIDDILDLSAIEAGRVPLTPEVVPVDDLIARNLEIIRSVARRFDVRVQVDELPPGLSIWADRRRLKQVLLNLATNAAKYNRRGGTLTISARLISDSTAEFSVSDQGQGINSEQMTRLFEPFERFGAAGGTVEGTGIGLTICKRLVQLMQGSIDVESIVGTGSIFRVRLPSAPPGSVGTDTPFGSSIDYARTQPSANGRPLVVLYVEDDPASSRLVEQAFNLLPDVQIQVRSDPITALRDAAELKPDLLLLDLGLPGMSGATLLGRLRDLGIQAPALAVSALASRADVETTLSAGFTNHLKKPIDVSDLLERVKSLLGSSASLHT